MVSGDGIAQHRQNARAVNVFQRCRLRQHLIEEGRQTNIGGIILPVIGIGTHHVDRFPFRCTFEHFRILFAEHLGGNFLYRARNFTR